MTAASCSLAAAADVYGEEKTCRICLDVDAPETMIVPCYCKGSSRFVHRDCLDLWRTRESNRAFSQCTECQFPYRFMAITTPSDHQYTCCCCSVSRFSQQQQRRAKFCILVTRDMCCVTFLVQFVIVALGGIIYLLDSQRNLVRMIMGSDDVSTGMDCASYYLAGTLVIFILMGIYGTLLLSKNGCKIPIPNPNIHNEEQNNHENHRYKSYTEATKEVLSNPRPVVSTEPIMDRRSLESTLQPLPRPSFCSSCRDVNNISHQQQQQQHFYQTRHRQWVAQHYQPRNPTCGDECFRACCIPRYGYSQHPGCYNNNNNICNYYPVGYYGNGKCCYYCFSCCNNDDCCPDDNNHDCCDSAGGGSCCHCPNFHPDGGGSGGNNNCGDDCCCCEGAGHNNHECGHVCGIILFIFAIVLAVIGFFVGLVLSVMVVQQIIQRHIFLLHKQQLVQEFPIQDLSGMDISSEWLDKTDDAPPCAYQGMMPLSTHSLEPEDALRLKRLGLLV